MTPLSLEPGTVHLWRVWLSTIGSEAEGSLSPAEQARAASLPLPARARWVAGRGWLREVLARYLDRPPASLRFTAGEQGKPALAGHPLHFNLAHSYGLALLAVAGATPLGVDVECVLREVARPRLVARHFTPQEQRALAAVPTAAQRLAFFHGWTRREALTKGRGGRMGGPPPLTTLPLSGADDRERVASIAGWSLFHLEPAPAFVGALAAVGEVASVRWMG